MGLFGPGRVRVFSSSQETYVAKEGKAIRHKNLSEKFQLVDEKILSNFE